MVRRALALCTLLLAGCECETKPKRHEEVAASVKSPEAAVRLLGVEVPEPCDYTGFERPLCLFENRTAFDGCAYLEVGPRKAVSATTPSDVEAACLRAADSSAQVYPLPEVTPSVAVQLEADPAGSRLALHVDGTDTWHVFYLDRGELVASDTFADPAIDWAKVPSFEAAVDRLVRSPIQGVERVFEVLEQRAGPEAKRARLESMVTDLDLPIDPVLQRLDDEQKARLRETLKASLAEDPTPGGLERYVLLGGKPDGAMLDAWATTLERVGLEDFDGLFAYEEELRTLIDGKHPKASELSCRLLGALVLGGTEEELGFDPMLGGEPIAQTALTGVALGKAPCPWVTELLARYPCLPELRCAPDGRALWEVMEGPLTEDDEETWDPDADDALIEQSDRFPLCTQAQVTRHLARWTDWVDYGSPGPALLAAAYAQGPLPPALVKRNARRGYRVIAPRRARDADEEDTCDRVRDSLATFACQVPAEANTIAAGSCELRFDDANRTITLRPLAARAPDRGASTPDDEL